MVEDVFRIRFALRALDEIEPWNFKGRRYLSWFGLSDGYYCIETAAGPLLGQSSFDPGQPESWCDYQVVRLFEDILDLWPLVYEPVPSDVFERFDRWFDLKKLKMMMDGDNEPLQDKWEAATRWWFDRHSGFEYLAQYPTLILWRIDNDIHLRWIGTSIWPPLLATLRIPFESVQTAVTTFLDDFLAAMAERVALVEQRGLRQIDCEIDIPRLISEQLERRAMTNTGFASRSKTDWDEIRRCLTELGG